MKTGTRQKHHAPRVDSTDEVFRVHDFSLSECEFKDDEEETADFVEEKPDDSGSERGLVSCAQSDLASDPDPDGCDMDGGKLGRSGRRKRKRNKEKDVEALNERRGMRRRAMNEWRATQSVRNLVLTSYSASSLDLLLKCSPTEGLRHRVYATREDVSCDALHGAQGGYVGRKALATQEDSADLGDLLASGYTLVKAGSHAVAAVDSEDRVVLVRVRRPIGVENTILDKINPVLNKIAKIKNSAPPGTDHTRGDFKRVQAGYYHGTGSKAPHLLAVKGKGLTAQLNTLLRSAGMESLLNHVRSSLMTWFPDVSKHLAEQHDLIKGKVSRSDGHPHCHNSPFTTLTLNLGPRTVTTPHRDAGNLQSGLCVVFVPGTHKARDGGHLVIKEAKMVLELGAGDAVILPSALVTHWNTTLKRGAVRQSLVFWSCGRSIRFFDMNERLMKDLSKEEQKEETERALEQWRAGTARFLSLSSLTERK